MSLPAEPVLLLIDVQKGFDDPNWGVRNNPDCEANIGKLLDAWRQAKLPVWHVQHLSTDERSPLAPSKPGCEIKDFAKPLNGEPLIQKNVNSAFIGTSLEKDLREKNLHTLVLVGLTTNHCVSTTARMAGNLGFQTYVVADATATFDRMGPDGMIYSAEQVHKISLASLHHEFATVCTTAGLVRLINGKK